MTGLLTFDGASVRDPAIDAWLDAQRSDLAAIASHWFEEMRQSGTDVLEIFHDGHPVVCLGNLPFAYVNVFRFHVNVGFFYGVDLPDPAHLLQGSGRMMRHAKLRPGESTDSAALSALIHAAGADIRDRAKLAG